MLIYNDAVAQREAEEKESVCFRNYFRAPLTSKSDSFRFTIVAFQYRYFISGGGGVEDGLLMGHRRIDWKSYDALFVYSLCMEVLALESFAVQGETGLAFVEISSKLIPFRGNFMFNGFLDIPPSVPDTSTES